MKKKISELTLGVCYYPEQWDESLWQNDLQRMKEHGITMIRIAEFSWTIMEGKEGEYDFSFWDRFLKVVEKEGLKVIFCTPTATPPAWLTRKYPEVLNADGDGHLIHHGMRRHYNLTSTKYLELCGLLVEQMGRHFNQYSCIIGWQIDNEVNCEIHDYYAASDHVEFRKYVKEKYKTLEAFNEAMGTTFWNQTYTDWEEVHLARRSPSGLGAGNPHLMLEQKRFISQAAIRFIAHQAKILSKTKEDRFVTTNGIFPDIDYQELLNLGIDFISYDNYPNFAYQAGRNSIEKEDLKDRNASFNLARVRAISPVFGIMEQQSGPGGWNSRMLQPSPKPGQMRLWVWQAFAHGADFISFFRWRTASKGTEIYWHGLNDYCNEPNRRLAELQQIHQDIHTVNGLTEVITRPYEAKVAILTDYDNIWDGESDIWHGPLREYSIDGWFRALQHQHIPFDFVDIRDEKKAEELFKYDLIIYPHAVILSDKRIKMLEEYVKHGGQLVMGCRTGYKDILGQCPMQALPGLAGELCGVRVTDFTTIGPFDQTEYMEWDGELVSAPVFNDILSALPGSEIRGHFINNYYDGSPALVSRNYGNGIAWYFGAGFGEDTAALFLKKLGIESPLKGIAKLPREVETAIRGDILLFLNYDSVHREIIMENSRTEILSGEVKEGKCKIEPYGVWLLRINKSH